MRILLDDRIKTGGVARYARLLADGLRSLPGAPEVERVTEHLTGSWRSKPFTPWGGGAVARVARSHSIDLIHGLLLEVPSRGAPSVVTIHDLIPLRVPGSMPSSAARAVYRSILKGSNTRAARIIVPSSSTKDELEREGTDPGKIVIVPNAVDPCFRPCDSKEKVTARERFGDGKAYVAAVGGAKAHKNARVLPETARLIEEACGLSMACIGVRPVGSFLRAVEPLSDDDLRLFYGGAKATVVPSLVEGFGFPVIESLACGVPVVCGTRLGVLAHIKGGAQVVDVTDPEKIATEVCAIADDAHRRDRMASAGLDSAAELTVEAMARRTNAVYRDVLGPA